MVAKRWANRTFAFQALTAYMLNIQGDARDLIAAELTNLEAHN